MKGIEEENIIAGSNLAGEKGNSSISQKWRLWESKAATALVMLEEGCTLTRSLASDLNASLLLRAHP